MNKLLLFINILLAVGVTFAFSSNIHALKRGRQEITVVKRPPKKSVSVKTGVPATPKATPKSFWANPN